MQTALSRRQKTCYTENRLETSSRNMPQSETCLSVLHGIRWIACRNACPEIAGGNKGSGKLRGREQSGKEITMTIKKAAVIGAGAVGGYLISSLSAKLGENLYVIAKGERGERLMRDGLMVNGIRYDLNVKAPEEARDADVLFVTLKYQALDAALPDIEALVGEHTAVVSLMNGIDSEEIIGGRIGMEHMIYSLVRISSTRTGNSMEFEIPSGYNGIYLGMPGKKPLEDERIAAIAELFKNTPINLHLSEDILFDIWEKFALNISRNLPQAVIDVGAGAYDDSVYLKDVENKLRDEVVKIAAAKGIKLLPNNKVGAYTPSQKYSTLQDILAGRKTEIDMFCGALMKMGRELGIPTPYSEFIFDFIKCLEEKAEGKFDYSA